ncbi:hypothetical protein KQX54_015313 [Cotesia glomerata]|uniref:Uncharacterized protein n=1 Tax=Cotesia glomerata TaxID=32391 RepID=A0AAV7HVR6_COTGL|nr:hypothetical protein KQX54_015313 [Cotesia glomerata]
MLKRGWLSRHASRADDLYPVSDEQQVSVAGARQLLTTARAVGLHAPDETGIPHSQDVTPKIKRRRASRVYRENKRDFGARSEYRSTPSDSDTD